MTEYALYVSVMRICKINAKKVKIYFTQCNWLLIN